jgi:D-serine deaminase-like pyridoxal phosphate-dependent protein
MKHAADLIVPAPAKSGDRLESVGTPALLVDLDAFENNLAQMQALSTQHAVALRPHAKAHKSSAIAHAQLALGAVGICCQKLSEAYPFAQAGVTSIHISNEFVGSDKIAMAIALAQCVDLSICVDHPAQVDAIGRASTAAGIVISVLPEIDLGHGRCGVGDTDALAELVDRIAAHRGLRFGGLQAYHGGIQHQRNWAQRRADADASAGKIAQYLQYLEARGIRCPVVTGGGTGTAEFDAASGVFTEIQPGSYVFMDADYGNNEWRGERQWRHSLFIASTIMSTAKQGLAVCDVGLKSVAVDSGLPTVHAEDGMSGYRYASANDEHGIISLPADDRADHLGARLLLIPGHCDQTANLHDQYVCVRNGVVEKLWDIDARGLSR